MPINVAKKSSWGIFFVFLAAFFVITYPNSAHAGVWECATNPLGCMRDILIELLTIWMSFMGYCIQLSTALLITIIQNTNFTEVPIVKVGWRVMLDFANLFFILILLVIGFATIFRQETYGLKALLPRLIIVALLINFSKIIAGVILDAGNLLTEFFLAPMGDKSKLGASLVQLMNIQKVYEPQLATLQLNGTRFGAQSVAGVNALFGAAAGAVIMGVAAVGIFLYSFVFVARIIFIWILVVFAPLAWMASILPGTRRFSQMWWSNFMKWVFVAPLMSFFLFLLAAMAQEAGNSGQVPSINALLRSPTGAAGATTFLADSRFLLQYAVVIAFIYAGPFAAQSLGGMMGSGVIGMVGAGQKWMMGKGGGLLPLARGARWLGGKAGGYAADRGKERVAPQLQKWGEQLAMSNIAKIPVIGGAFGKMGRAGMKYGGASQRAAIAEHKKETTTMSTPELIAAVDSLKNSTNISKRMAYSEALTERRDLSEKDKKGVGRKGIAATLDVARRTGYDYESYKAMLAANPTLAKDSMEMEKAVREARRTGQDKHFGEDAFKAVNDIVMVDADGKPTGKLMNASKLLVNLQTDEQNNSPEAFSKYAETLGKKERDAFLEASLNTVNTAGEEFNAKNTNIREGIVKVRPELFVQAISDASQKANDDLGKIIIRSMKGDDLEKAMTGNIYEYNSASKTWEDRGEATEIDPATGDKRFKSQAVARLQKIEELRGISGMKETFSAIKKSGVDKIYEKDLSSRLETDRKKAEAANDADILYTDANVRRMAILAMLSGNFKGYDNNLSGKDSKGREWQAFALGEKQNFVANISDENMEEFGKRADDRITQKQIAENASVNKFSIFLQNIEPKDRDQTFVDAYDRAERDRDPAWMNSAFKNDFLQYMARRNDKRLQRFAPQRQPKNPPPGNNPPPPVNPPNNNPPPGPQNPPSNNPPPGPGTPPGSQNPPQSGPGSQPKKPKGGSGGGGNTTSGSSTRSHGGSGTGSGSSTNFGGASAFTPGSSSFNVAGTPGAQVHPTLQGTQNPVIQTQTQAKPQTPSTQQPTNKPATPDYIIEAIERGNTAAEKLEIADDIEELSAQWLTAKQVAEKLKQGKLQNSKLSVSDIARELVQPVRSKRHIPSMDDSVEFDKWINNRSSSTPPTTSSIVSAPITSMSTAEPKTSDEPKTPVDAETPEPPTEEDREEMGSNINQKAVENETMTDQLQAAAENLKNATEAIKESAEKQNETVVKLSSIEPSAGIGQSVAIDESLKKQGDGLSDALKGLVSDIKNRGRLGFDPLIENRDSNLLANSVLQLQKLMEKSSTNSLELEDVLNKLHNGISAVGQPSKKGVLHDDPDNLKTLSHTMRNVAQSSQEFGKTLAQKEDKDSKRIAKMLGEIANAAGANIDFLNKKAELLKKYQGR